ncbi:outer membrane lipase/esterase [Vulcaniibacterium tengchongense]|uniref:Outer membrane lipase/esterase n=1 Tax=Vulcaniibacterium tengchongense TaxID=1273429 RepID=A0A3N4VD09_9GAMM|nr:outer membrane lipase/esterase [Vulcaniibacterium tengchongense]
MTKPVRTLLAAALALATAPAFAQTYSQTIFFGDSLTDSGYFRPVLVAANPSAAILGRFTTNPGLVWAEYLAGRYGTDATSVNQGGSNYAIGGALVATDRPGLLPTLSLRTQIGNHLAANGGRADAHALYTVWGGANDLFAAAANPAQAQAIVGAAVTAQVGNVMTLQNAGARYVLVPNIPDLGITPQFRAQGAAAQAQGTALATAYNDALFGGLAAAGARVIPLDTFHLLQEIAADPAPYGIVNVTGTACQPQVTAQSLTCNPATYAAPNAPDTYLFADGVHPSSKAHAVMADYAVSVLEAPRQLAVLPHSAATVGRARADRVAAQLQARPEGAGARWWADVRGDSQRYGDGDLYDGMGPTLSFGVDWASGRLVYGGFVGYGRQKLDWGRNGGEFDQDDTSLGGYLGWSGGAAWVDAQLSYTRLGFDVERRVVLGPTSRTHRGSPDGSNLSAAVNAGWNFGEGALRHGPVVGLLSQRIEVDGYAEDSAESTALAFPKQEFDSLIGSVGWQVDYAHGAHLRPYAKLTYDHEFEDGEDQAYAQLRSVPGLAPYAVPGLEFDRDYGTLSFGARSTLFGLNADVGTRVTVGQKGGNDATVYLSLGGSF